MDSQMVTLGTKDLQELGRAHLNWFVMARLIRFFMAKQNIFRLQPLLPLIRLKIWFNNAL